MVGKLVKMNPSEWKNIPIPLIDGFVTVSRAMVEMQKAMQE